MEVALVELRPSAGRRHRVGEGIVIGREQCDIALVDAEVSRRHAVVRVAGEALEVEDLGSTNGTFVNEERIAGTSPLAVGDEIRIGGCAWRVEGPPVPAAAPGPEPAAPAQPLPAPSGIRGDVPPPTLSKVQRQPAPAPDAGQLDFRPPPPAKAPRRGRVSAARIDEATIVSYVVVGLTALAVILYFALR
jgi:predicted component of type VI protein secretion system